jgi:anti-sigma28 factor (negative regulator of flagellin synthesis)
MAMSLIAAYSIACSSPEVFADWGYDQSDKNARQNASKPGASGDWSAHETDELTRPVPTSQSARTSQSKRPGQKATGAATETKSPATRTAMFSQPDEINLDKSMRVRQAKVETAKQQILEVNEKLVNQWLELYGLVSKEPLTDEQQSRFKQKLMAVAAAQKPGVSSFSSIQKFWPQVKSCCHQNVEQQANYRELFRALMRLEVHDKQANPNEVELINEVLGLERIAVPENPPLTEEAVEAYADMTCFIYAQTHPGKTVDALDNRTVFVATLEHRYLNEATPLEKLAMSYFALKWSKFKVLYGDADESDKQKLFKRISGLTPESLRKDITNSTLDAVLNNGPWVHALTSSSELAVPKLPPKMIEEKAHAKSL